MKKMILLGKTGCGKTTLAQALHGLVTVYRKTQALEFYSCIIDTPGEYIENRNYYSALITSSVDSDIIALVQDPTEFECVFPPNFGFIFNKPVVGIITKLDCMDKDIKMAEECLRQAGANKIFHVSSTTGDGIEEIKKLLI